MSDCSKFVRRMLEKNISPMPFIGLYAAAASMLCSLAMFLSTCITFYNWLHQFNVRFSGNFFSLNATWLTLLAVATKLTGDLTSPMWSPRDNLAKITSTVFFTVSMGNFFTTLGSMNDTDILTNLPALSMLVISVLVDLCIQLSTGALDFSLFPEIIFAIVLFFCMFIIIVSSALAVPAIKKRAESKYQKLASDEKRMERQQHTIEELRLSITKYWVMAASGSPRFLMKRLVTFFFTSIICLFSAVIAFLALYRTTSAFKNWTCHKESDYKWSVELILVFQYYAAELSVVIATIILISVMGDKYEDNGIKISREEFTIESYWTEKLVEWRQSSIPLSFKRHAVRKLLHYIKGLILTFCIRIQIVIVMWCKFCCVVSFYSMLPLIFLVNHLRKLFHKIEVSNDQGRPEIDLNCSVILLEGEKQFPNGLLRKIINRVDELIETGKMQRPQNLFYLLNYQSFSFEGLKEFDSNRVPSLLLSDEPPNCWTLPVVTLTSIAIALPNIASQNVDWLVSSVHEGLRYASLIDVLDDKCGLKSIKNAADVVWLGVEFHKKWFNVDLEDKIGEVHSAKEIIQVLADVAKRIVMEFISIENGIIVENPLYWPANVLAANSMYRISRTILLYYENGECQVEELFRKLIRMIADILAACLTNLPHMIATKCRSNAIEERLESVRDASILFGEIEDILKFFEERQLSSDGPSQPLCNDEWRRWREIQDPAISTFETSNGTPSTIEYNEDVVI